MTVPVVNFGCRLNIAEGAAAAAAAATAGADDIIIINSCAVTAEAERQTRQAIRRAAAANPARRVVVTGCMADTSRPALAAMPQVAGIVSNADKTAPAAWAAPDDAPGDIFAPTRPFAPITSGAGHARAFIAVQNGCDHRCTFCIIPYGRGNSRSAPMAEVVAAAAAAVARGQREVVLTGVDVTSYGHDLAAQPRLGDLVAAILVGVPGLARLRLSSLDSVEIDPLLFDLIVGEARVMPHLHLSLQAGDDMILKRMKRRHRRADAVALVEALLARRPEIAIGADIIAGFPTEDGAMFARSLALIDDCHIVHGHIFPYSPRSGTPAARMPQLDRAVVRARAAELRARCAERAAAWRQTLVGSHQQMLVERDGQSGHGENFMALRLNAPAPPGSILAVRVGADGHGAEVVEGGQ